MDDKLTNLWSLRFAMPRDRLPAYVAALEAENISVSWDVTGQDEATVAEAIISMDEEEEGGEKVSKIFASVCENHSLQLPEVETKCLPQKDWVAENRKQFPPLTVGNFFVYSPYFEGLPPADKISFKINAALAFGSGEHETTKGCLIGLERLHKEQHDYKTALDVGCGSGILALAMAKLWPDLHILATDFDPRAVATAHQNAVDNEAPNIEVRHCDGFQGVSTTKVDLIAANILAAPLISFAPEMVARLKPAGTIVLSGLLERQAEEVLKAYRREGLHCVARFGIQGWETLMLNWGG
jgi:ribosomal protein L11 methyltransferase